jgi:hypothetical protein
MRELHGPRLSTDELHDIVLFVKSSGQMRKRGKTAFVSGSDLDFGISRMIESIAENEALPWMIKPLRSMKVALQWITA